MKFANIVDRLNGSKIDYSWFNALRDAGKNIENFIGAGGSQTELTATIGNGVTAAVITGMLPVNTYKKHIFEYWVKRISTSTGATTVMEVGTLVAWYDGTSWNVARLAQAGDAGIDFLIDNVTTPGQIQATTTTISGTYDATNSKIGWFLRTQG